MQLCRWVVEPFYIDRLRIEGHFRRLCTRDELLHEGVVYVTANSLFALESSCTGMWQ